jgi:hypothetical protein
MSKSHPVSAPVAPLPAHREGGRELLALGGPKASAAAAAHLLRSRRHPRRAGADAAPHERDARHGPGHGLRTQRGSVSEIARRHHAPLLQKTAPAPAREPGHAKAEARIGREPKQRGLA